MTPLLLSALVLAAPDAGSSTTPTQAVMRGALEALFGLEPIIANPERLRDPLQAEDIGRRLDVLASLQHAFPADAKAQEPATAALSGLFSQYALETRRRFNFGDRQTVPARVRTLMSLCFTCHSRERAPADYQDMEKRLEAMKLSPFDKAQYLAATRQFDKAVDAYGAVIAQPAKDEKAVLLQARAIRELLTLLVRVKDDAKATDAFLEGLSTRADLAPFLKRPVTAPIFIDGIDSRQIDPAELRRAIGFVPQDVTLFYGTLKHNIAMGAPFADDSAILAAAELSGVREFADTHPQGFEMPIGERGESLSGGQRQAVAIARALLNDPPILLLDEPSSSMDHQSEEGLKQRLRRFAASKTMILVTHRTSLLDLVDRLIVLDQGQIVADGPKAQVVEALQQGRIGRAG